MCCLWQKGVQLKGLVTAWDWQQRRGKVWLRFGDLVEVQAVMVMVVPCQLLMPEGLVPLWVRAKRVCHSVAGMSPP